MLKTTYDSWLDATVAMFEETEEGAKALEWLQTEDFVEAFEDGLTPVQVYDKFCKGYWF
jgi:hypothetical protein